MIVTINTDASWHRQTKIGAFSFWIVCDDFKITKSGPLKRKCKDSDVAEFRSIINAVHTLFTSNPRKINLLVINTDSLNCIHLLKKDKKAISRYGLKGEWSNYLVNMFYGIVGETKCDFRHIKSHQHTDTAKNWVNDWCDKQAKEQLWKKVNSLKA